MKHIKRLGWLIALLWSVFGFFASNSPAEVTASMAGWTALPWLQQVLTSIAALALNPLFYVASVFVIGGIAGWQLNNFVRKRKSSDWWDNLGVKMSLLNYDIKDASYYGTDSHILNGMIDVVRLEAQKHDIAFPLHENGFTNTDHLTPYLGRVSVLLEAGKVKEAKQLATSMSKKPPTI